jgi:hypothetical protein
MLYILLNKHIKTYKRQYHYMNEKDNETNCKFVSTRGIAKNCNIYPKPIIPDTCRIDLRHYANIKNNDVV